MTAICSREIFVFSDFYTDYWNIGDIKVLKEQMHEILTYGVT
jgi:hypothetical protein